MMKFIDKNKVVLLVVGLLIAFVWAGKKMKQGREEQRQKLAAEAQSPGPKQGANSSAPARTGSNMSPQGLHVLSETYDKDGKKTILLSEKSKEQLAKEQQAFELAKMQVTRDAKSFQQKVNQKVEILARTRFKGSEVQSRMQQIAERTNISDNERGNDYTRLRNQVMISATSPAEKERMLSQIDAKLNSLSAAPFKGYISTLQKDGSVMLTPR